MQIPRAKSVDFAYWARERFWTADQATALSYARDPESFWDDDMIKYSPNWGSFRDRRDRLAEALSNTMRPTDCLAWGKLNGIHFQEALVLEILKHENDVFEKCETLTVQLAQRDRRIEEVAAKLKAAAGKHQSDDDGEEAAERFLQDVIDLQPRYDELKTKCTELTAENDKYKAKIGELDKKFAEMKTIDDLKPKSINSLYDLIYGLIKSTYQKEYVPHARDGLVAEIEGDLKRVEVKMNNATIRGWLQRVYDHRTPVPEEKIPPEAPTKQ